MAGRKASARTLPGAGAATPGSAAERVLLAGVRGCLTLVLAMPLVVLVDAGHGFVVGKALFAHTAIEVALVLWTLLALANPAFLPPRSKLLALLALGLAWGVVAAGFGVSWQRSLWSTYPRLGGVVGAAHWLAFALLVAAVFRPRRLLRRLITVNLAASILVAVLAAYSANEMPLPLYGPLLERDFPRVGGTLGNAIPLGVYAVLNVVLALTLLATDLTDRRRRAADPTAPGMAKRIGLRLFWASATIANCWVFSRTGSITATIAALGGGAACAAALAIGGTGRWRAAAIGGLALTSTATIALVATFLFVKPAPEDTQNLLLRRIAEISAEAPWTQAPATSPDAVMSRSTDRLHVWQAAWAGFVERPMLGWGPENFLVAFGRYGTEAIALAQPHADAHNAWVEKIATEGLPGLACFAALWAAAGLALLRAARDGPPTERGFVLGMATALACLLVASQTANWSITTNLMFVLLLAAVAQLEAGDAAPGRLGALLARNRPLRLGLAIGAAALAAVGFNANYNLYRGAIAFGNASAVAADPYSEVPTAERATRTLHALPLYQRAIAACNGLANQPRRFLFDDLEFNWRALRVRHAAEAKRWLEYAEAQAAEALAAEPQNWLIHQSLARLYLRVETTDPAYRSLAAHYVRSSAELAPNIPIYRPPLK